MVAEQGRAHQRNVAQQWNGKLGPFGQLGLHVRDAAEGRETNTKQAQRQTGGVLVGVEPDHQHPKNGGQQGPGTRTCRKPHPVVAGVDHRCKPGNRGAQHHAFRPQIHDAGFFVDQQAQGRDGQHGARVQRGSQ